jgi:deoxyribodipyrimidine photo-lyase
MSNEDKPVIVLFRNDLRIADNRALASAADSGKPVVALVILDNIEASTRKIGAASRWWLHHSLAALETALQQLGARLFLREGATAEILAEAIRETGADTVFWNRRYAPREISADRLLKERIQKDGLSAESFDGFLLHQPSQVRSQSGDLYKVFTPFYRQLKAADDPRDPVDPPKAIVAWKGRFPSIKLDDLKLLPTKPDWSGGLDERWQPGEKGAHHRLATFLHDGLEGYARRRDVPGEEGTSGLSPHLAHGEITPFQIMAAVRRRRSADADMFRRELGWREFSYHVLSGHSELERKSFRPEFERIQWRDAPAELEAWKSGQTGIPIVDAGMRELWQTGYMHNRVRMIAASFLVKDLLIDWRKGEAWFWDTLVDADAANNPMNWQWVAGVGADAAPYFRVFNPMLQGEKFDPRGSYVRQYLPELNALPDRYIHRPWEAPDALLRNSRIELGRDYPKPMVDHEQARMRAIEAFRVVRKS